MSTSDTQSDQANLPAQRFITLVWYISRRPQVTAVLISIVAVALLLGWLLPQQTGPLISAESWIDSLHPVLQPAGNLMFSLGLSQVFQSIWWWFPLGLLLLNSMVALIDFLPACRRRAQNTWADIEWQHPLAQRVEHSVRLSDTPDEFLEQLKKTLDEHDFSLDPPPEEDQRPVSASRRRWVWLAIPALYGGIIVATIGAILTFSTLRTEQLTLWPFKTTTSRLFDSAVELHSLDDTGSRGTVIFDPNRVDQPALALFLQPYRPVFFKQTLVWATAIEPVLTVEAIDSSGQRRRLIPIQTELPPDTRISLPLNSVDDALYFFIPSVNLAFQILPTDPTASAGQLNVQIQDLEEDIAPETVTIETGDRFEIDDLSIQIAQNYRMQISARRDFGLPFLGAGLLVVLGSGLLLLAFSPWQVWLIPDVKGRGGQLYGVAETLRPAQEASHFIETVLSSTDGPSTDQEET